MTGNELMRQKLFRFLGFLSKEPPQPNPGYKGKSKNKYDNVLPEAERKQPDERVGVIEKPWISGEEQAMKISEKLPKTHRRKKTYSQD